MDQVEQLGLKQRVDFQDEYFHNDIFRKYWLRLGGDLNNIQANLIYPATEMLINKYSKQEHYSVRETSEVYA